MGVVSASDLIDAVKECLQVPIGIVLDLMVSAIV